MCSSRHVNLIIILVKESHQLDYLLLMQYILYEFGIFQGKPPDWQDFVGIITLLVINSTISFIEENNAGNAAAALMARLAPKAKVCGSF